MIVLVGLNHRTASIEIREKFSFLPEEIVEFQKLFENSEHYNGLVVVSTCNRTEIYCDYATNNKNDIKDIIVKNLLKFKNYDNDINHNLYTLANKDVITHLFKVVTGLDSMILGEYQIVGQLKDAIEISETNKYAGKCLLRLFQKAFETGKLARTNTKINEGAVTVSYAAVETAYTIFPDLHRRNILSVGAGETGQLVVAGLVKKKCTNISIANRTFENTVKVAQKYNAKAIEIEKLKENIALNDVVVVSTSSKTPLITANDIKTAMPQRQNKELLLLDLSVPRNIEMEVAEIENVKLLSVDDMQNVVLDNYKKRESEIKKVEEIIENRTNEFMDWIQTGKLTPTFIKISEKFKEINASELEGFQKNKYNIDYTKAQEYGEHITNKYIRLLIKNIKEVTENGKNTEKLKLVNELLDL